MAQIRPAIEHKYVIYKLAFKRHGHTVQARLSEPRLSKLSVYPNQDLGSHFCSTFCSFIWILLKQLFTATETIALYLAGDVRAVRGQFN